MSYIRELQVRVHDLERALSVVHQELQRAFTGEQHELPKVQTQIGTLLKAAYPWVEAIHWDGSADDWNETFGDCEVVAVRFWPLAGHDPSVDTVTRSEAWTVCENPVVKVEGRSGGVALSHIQVLYASPRIEKGGG